MKENITKEFVHNLSEFEAKRLSHIRQQKDECSRLDIDREYQRCLTKILRDNGHHFIELLSVQTMFYPNRKPVITALCSIGL
ncbi:MAG: hypothetical protein HRU20_06060 [Pseudomonadales bacterium]|nr:hypothetical protein [Pseudomonadales bacterium]